MPARPRALPAAADRGACFRFGGRPQLDPYGFAPRSGQYVVTDRDWRKVEQRLPFALANPGQPVVQVTDANHADRGELYLRHRFEGVPLADDEHQRLPSFDGAEHTWARL